MMLSDTALLVHHNPILLGDSDEHYIHDTVTIHGCVAGAWLQYWFAYSGDRDHEGTDWEMVMLKLEGGNPIVVVFAQHKWCRALPWSLVDRDGPRLRVYVGKDKHASYAWSGWHRHGRHFERANGKQPILTILEMGVPAGVKRRMQHRDPDAWVAGRLRGYRPRALRL